MEEKVFEHNFIGVESEEVKQLRQNAPKVNDEEAKFALLINDYYKTKQILKGIVLGATEISDQTVVEVEFNGHIIYIRDVDFYMKGYSFGPEYDAADEKTKAIRRRNDINRFCGAVIPFVITAFTNGEQFNKSFNLLEGLYIFASRTQAMLILQDIFYYHKNRSKNSTLPPRTINVGDIVEANVLMEKGKDRVVIEFCGSETILNRETLPFDYNTGRVKTLYPGETVKVKVQKIYDKDGELRILCTGRFYKPFKDIDKIKSYDVMWGWVVNYSIDNKSYQIILKNGCPCTVKKDKVKNGAILTLNDRVMVRILRVVADKGFVIGEAKKMNF